MRSPADGPRASRPDLTCETSPSRLRWISALTGRMPPNKGKPDERTRRRSVVVLSAIALVGHGGDHRIARRRPTSPPGGVDLEVYEGEVDAAGIETMRELGSTPPTSSSTSGGRQSRGRGRPERGAGRQAARRASTSRSSRSTASRRPRPSSNRRRRVGRRSALRHPVASRTRSWPPPPRSPRLTKVVVIGETVNGQEILAVKVTEDADTSSRTASARRCSTLGPARPGVDHAGDDPAADALLPGQLRH